MPTASSDGPHRMRALAAALPGAMVDGFRLGRELSLPSESHPGPLFVAGMGGSGIAAELARGLVEAETPVPMQVVRSPTLPAALSSRSRVVITSYSGSTSEALRAYEAAGRAGAHRVVLTSGGELAEHAARDRVPLLPLPPGLPPRAAVGTMFGGLLGLLDPWFPESNEERVRRVAERVRPFVASCALARGPAARLARAIGPRLPFIYAESSFAGVARRWKTQVEENAKRLAVFDERPELFHNAIVGWDAIARRDAGRYAVVQLEWAGSPPPARQGADYVQRLLRARGVTALAATLPGDDRLEAIVGGVVLGDYASLFLADVGGVDPYPVEAIGRLKAAMAPLGAAPGTNGLRPARAAGARPRRAKN